MSIFSNRYTGDFVHFLEKSLWIDSTTGREKEMALFLKLYIENRFNPDQIHLQEVADNRFNIIVVKGTPRFFMSTHLDTVPDYFPPYFSEGRLYGRGACDAKGQIAAQLWALETLIGQGVDSYGLVYVVGEEVDSIGAYAAVTHPLVKGEFLLNGEPTDNKFVSSSKGVMELHIEATGKSSHTSQVPLDSAIHKLCHDISILSNMESEDLLLNAGVISGGAAPNVAAAQARADVCVRYNGNPHQVFKKISESIHSKCTCKGGYILPSDFYVPDAFHADHTKVSFCSDATIFKECFDNVMLFGAGSIKNAHDRNEYIDLEELVIGKDKIVTGLQTILGGN